MRFSTETGRFSADYLLDKSIRAPTVVYINEDYWYKHGYKITVDAEDSSDDYTVTKLRNRIEIIFNEDAKSSKVSFTITAPSKRN